MKIIYYLPLLLIANCLLAQGSYPNNFTIPSANNNFLGKAGAGGTDVSIDLYTGAAQVQIPICALASRELNIPVSLNYVDGKGVKLHEYATQVGLGWQLSAGGSITRVVRAFPDDEENGYLGTGTQPSGDLPSGVQWGVLMASFCANNGTMTDVQHVALFGWGHNVNTNVQPTADGEPDIFYVKTPFFNFQFTFNAYGTPVFSNSNGYKVVTTNFVNSTNYFNSSFLWQKNLIMILRKEMILVLASQIDAEHR